MTQAISDAQHFKKYVDRSTSQAYSMCCGCADRYATHCETGSNPLDHWSSLESLGEMQGRVAGAPKSIYICMLMRR